MPLDIANQPALLPTGLLSANLNAFVLPAQNIVHGYNMAEQTCFHKTTVSNVIPGFSRLSAFVKAIGALLQPVTALISAAITLIADVTSAVGLTRTMLTTATTVIGAVTTVVGTVTTLVGTTIGLLTAIIGSITTIIGTLGGIAAVCLVAAIAAGIAGGLFFFGFVQAGGVALSVLLAIVFLVVRGAVTTIAAALGTLTTPLATSPLATLRGALGTLTTPLGTLTGALGPLNTAIGAVDGILANSVLPSGSLAGASTALTNLQNDLATGGQFTNTLASTTMTLDQRVAALQTFLKPGQTKVPRAHLEDTYQDAIAIYNAGLCFLNSQLPCFMPTQSASLPVWNAMRGTANNKPQIEPGGILDTTLTCPAEFREG